ncbi:MAG TPA: hypothetical protein VGS27_00260 [Candidatus Sulfotelmatobacter sp.]|nr:hypothetical protein [Candidatus Sulfotelmatobacter sp.]
MRTLPLGGVLCLIFGCMSAWAQGAPALDTFTSPDGAFQFVYPETYELLVGERILKATQTRRAGIPVCNFSTAFACVMYPIEVQEETPFEAAAFSVGTVPGIVAESDCLSYADKVTPSHIEALQVTAISINDHVFRHASAKRKVAGHVQATDLYRTYIKQTCYELQINVSVSADLQVQKQSAPITAVDGRANIAHEALRLVLSSFVFRE